MRLRVHVRTRVDQQHRLRRRGQRRRDRRTIHTRHRTQKKKGRRHDRTGGTSAHEGVRFLFFLQSEADRDRALPLAPHRRSGRLTRQNRLLRMHDVQPARRRAVMLRQLRIDAGLIAYQQKLKISGQIAQRLECPRHLDRRVAVRTHGVQRDAQPPS